MRAKIEYRPRTRNDFMRDVVNQLIVLRHDRNMTQEDLNHKIGVADRLVSKWECGIRTPTSFNLYCWADALDGKIKIVPNKDRPPQSQEGNMGVIKHTAEEEYPYVAREVTQQYVA